jgi:hypothetical protein
MNYGRNRNSLGNVVRELGLGNISRHRSSDGIAAAALFFRMMRIFERKWEISVSDVIDMEHGKRNPSVRKEKKIRKPFPGS